MITGQDDIKLIGVDQPLFCPDELANQLLQTHNIPPRMLTLEHNDAAAMGQQALILPQQQTDMLIKNMYVQQCDDWLDSVTHVPSLKPVPEVGPLLHPQTTDAGSPGTDCTDSKSTSDSGFEKSITNITSSVKFNLDPIKRMKSDPGTSLDDIISSGIDPQSLPPQVLKRIKNTDSARRSRMRRQAKLKEMETSLDAQKSEIIRLREVTDLLRQELNTIRHENENVKISFNRLKTWLLHKGIRIPAELDFDKSTSIHI